LAWGFVASRKDFTSVNVVLIDEEVGLEPEAQR
jgi:hypothetical protein